MKRHYQYIDYARVYAIVAVVIGHVSGKVVMEYSTLLPGLWWYGNILDSFIRWSVPVFVMISGTLILGSKSTLPVQGYFKKRMHRVILPFALWLCIYKVLEYTIVPQTFTFKAVIVSVLSGDPFLHLYFFFIIVGLYVIAPMVRVFLVNSSEKTIFWHMLVFLMIPCIGSIIVMFIGNQVTLICGISYNAMTLWFPFTGYFIAGYYFDRIKITRAIRLAAFVCFFLGGVCVSGGTFILFKEMGVSDRAMYFYQFLSPPVILMSLSCFVLIRCFHETAVSVLFKNLAPLTFGVFLIHPLVMYCIERAGFTIYSLSLFLGLPIMVLIVMIISLAVVYGLKKSPLARLVA